MAPTPRVCLLGVLLLTSLAGERASAQSSSQSPASSRSVSLFLAGHLTAGLADACETQGDVVACRGLVPFAGLDGGAHYWPTAQFGVGLHLAGSHDLDASETVSSLGESEQRDQWLWRLSLSAELRPAVLLDGLWLGAELGGALLHDSFVELDGRGALLRAHEADQLAPLFGIALGWDFELGGAVALGPRLSAQLIALPDEPPRLARDVRSIAIGSAVWIELGLRFVVVD